MVKGRNGKEAMVEWNKSSNEKTNEMKMVKIPWSRYEEAMARQKNQIKKTKERRRKHVIPSY